MSDIKKLSIICAYCESTYVIRFDEAFDGPQFCSFCGEPLDLEEDDDLEPSEDDEDD
jgi:hypothetical protein